MIFPSRLAGVRPKKKHMHGPLGQYATSPSSTTSRAYSFSIPQVEFTTQYGNVYQGATVSNANGRITWTNPDGSTVWLSSDTNTYPNNAQYIQQYAPQYYTAPASSTSSTSSSSNSNAGLSPDVATLGLQMANIGSQAALAAGYSATDVPQYDSNGKIIPKSQAPAPVTTTPATTTTPASTQPQSSFSAVTGYQTGNAQLDAIVAGLQDYLNKMIASGQKINPNIALSPNDVQTFLNQAKNEKDPDFARQIEAVQTATSQNLTALQTQYEAEQTKENNAFQQSLASTRDTNEEYGTMQSSARNFQELQATQTANANATLNASQAQNSAQKLASSEASQVGDENVNNLPQFQNYTYSNQGIGGATAGSNLNYFNIGNYPTGTGSIEQSQQTAEQNRAIQLGQTQLQQRALNFYGT